MQETLLSRIRSFISGRTEPIQTGHEALKATEEPAPPVTTQPQVSYNAEDIGETCAIIRYTYDNINKDWDLDTDIYRGRWSVCQKYADMLNKGEITVEDIPEPSELELLLAKRDGLKNSLNVVNEDLIYFGRTQGAPEGADGKGEYAASVTEKNVLEERLTLVNNQIEDFYAALHHAPDISDTPPIAEIVLHNGHGFSETCTYTDPEAFKKDIREEIDIRGINAVSAKVLNDDQSLEYFVAKTYYESGKSFPPMNQWQYEKGLSDAEKAQFRDKLKLVYQKEEKLHLRPEFIADRLVAEPEKGNFIIDSFPNFPSEKVGEMVDQRLEALQNKEKELLQETNAVNQRSGQYRFSKQQRAENIIQLPQKSAERNVERQHPRTIKDKLVDAKIEADRINAERHAGRTARQHDMTR